MTTPATDDWNCNPTSKAAVSPLPVGTTELFQILTVPDKGVGVGVGVPVFAGVGVAVGALVVGVGVGVAVGARVVGVGVGVVVVGTSEKVSVKFGLLQESVEVTVTQLWVKPFLLAQTEKLIP